MISLEVIFFVRLQCNDGTWWPTRVQLIVIEKRRKEESNLKH